jgi:hypothetical protein
MVPLTTAVEAVAVAGRVNHKDEPERVASAVVPSVSHESTADTTDATGPFGSDAVVCPFTETRPIPISTLPPLASNFTRLDGLDGLDGLDEASISTTRDVAWIVVQFTLHDPEPAYTTGTEATKPRCGVYSNIVLFSGNPGPVYIFLFFFRSAFRASAFSFFCFCFRFPLFFFCFCFRFSFSFFRRFRFSFFFSFFRRFRFSFFFSFLFLFFCFLS